MGFLLKQNDRKLYITGKLKMPFMFLFIETEKVDFILLTKLILETFMERKS
jgi:hypothetical protein